MLCQTYPHIAAMMTNKNTRLLRAGRYLPYRTLSAWRAENNPTAAFYNAVPDT